MGHGKVSELEVKRIDFADKTDLYGTSLNIDPNGSAVEQEMYKNGITSGIALKVYKKLGRAMLTNPVSVNWEENYGQLYFYFYNAGYGPVTINFNNYTTTIEAKAGWQKVILGKDTVGVQGGGEKTVTDYAMISSVGGSTTVNGMVDPEDCVGTFLMFTSRDNYFEEFAMSAIYGVPREKQGGE